MASDRVNGRRLETRAALNLAELVAKGLVDLTEFRIADAHAVLAVEMELLEQLARIDGAGSGRDEARERLLGYNVDDGAGDLHDFVERRLVTEYLIAIGVDAVLTPLLPKRFAYSHIARDGSLVTIAGEVAPEAIVHRLTSCPRVLQYGLDASGMELRGLLFQRTAPVTSPSWPERPLLTDRETSLPVDLLEMIDSIDRGTIPAAPVTPIVPPSPKSAQTATRRRPRHIRLAGDS